MAKPKITAATVSSVASSTTPSPESYLVATGGTDRRSTKQLYYRMRHISGPYQYEIVEVEIDEAVVTPKRVSKADVRENLAAQLYDLACPHIDTVDRIRRQHAQKTANETKAAEVAAAKAAQANKGQG